MYNNKMDFPLGVIPEAFPTVVKTDFMYDAGKIEAAAIAVQIRSDKAPRTGVPTKPGHTWVADQRAKKGGYFRKLRPGQKDPSLVKGANGQPVPAKSGGGGAIGAAAGAGLATALTAAIAAGGAAALQQQQQEQQKQQEQEKTKEAIATGAKVAAGVGATALAVKAARTETGREIGDAFKIVGSAMASNALNSQELDPIIDKLPISAGLKEKAKGTIGGAKVALATNILAGSGYRIADVDKDNNIGHWEHKDGHVASIGSVGSHSFMMNTTKEKGKENSYSTNFTVDMGFQQKKVTSQEGKKLIGITKASFAKQMAKLPDGAIVYANPYQDDEKGEAREKIYKKYGFTTNDKKGGLWAQVQGGKLTAPPDSGADAAKKKDKKDKTDSLDDAILLYVYGQIRFDAYIDAREDALKRVNVPAKGDRDAYSYTRDVGDRVNVRQELKQPNRQYRLSGNNFVNQIDFMKIKIDPNAVAKAEEHRRAGGHANSVWPISLGDRAHLYKPVDWNDPGNTTQTEAASEVLLSSMARIVGIPCQYARLTPKALDTMRPEIPAPGVVIEKIAGAKTMFDQDLWNTSEHTRLPLDSKDGKARKYFDKMLEHPDLAKIAALDTFTMNTDRHASNIMVTNDESGSPRYGGKRYHAIDNGSAYVPVPGADPLGALSKEMVNLGDAYKGDRVRKENLKLYVNTLQFLSTEYPVAKIQAQMAQLNTAIDPYEVDVIRPVANSGKAEATMAQSIAATHRGAQKVVNAAKMAGLK